MIRVAATSWIPGTIVVGALGFGLLGSAIASSGANGPGYAYNDLSLPADAGKEICGRITTWPAFGTLVAYEDTSFVYTRTGDGADSFAYQLYVDGVAAGAPQTVTLAVGVVGATINLIGSATTQVATSSSGAAAIVPPAAGVVNLAGASATQSASSSTGAVSVTRAPIVINLAGTSATQGATSSTGAVTVMPPQESGNMSFTPSAARTITVNAAGAPFTAGSTFWSLADPKKPRGWKDPDATIDITFDWGPYLADIADSIRAGGLEFLPDGGLVVVGFTFVGAKCTVFLSAGTVANGASVTRAPVTCRITTSSTPPRIEDRTIFLDIESR